jgi:hypothetical protein
MLFHSVALNLTLDWLVARAVQILLMAAGSWHVKDELRMEVCFS